MIRFPLQMVRLRVKERPEGYYEDVVLSGRITPDGFIEFEDEAYRALCEKYRGPLPATSKQNCC